MPHLHFSKNSDSKILQHYITDVSKLTHLIKNQLESLRMSKKIVVGPLTAEQYTINTSVTSLYHMPDFSVLSIDPKTGLKVHEYYKLTVDKKELEKYDGETLQQLLANELIGCDIDAPGERGGLWTPNNRSGFVNRPKRGEGRVSQISLGNESVLTIGSDNTVSGSLFIGKGILVNIGTFCRPIYGKTISGKASRHGKSSMFYIELVSGADIDMLPSREVIEMELENFVTNTFDIEGISFKINDE